MKKIQYLLLSLIVIGGLIFRLYKINNPIADWHSWRQADTASVARNFIKDGYNFFRPQVDNFGATNELRVENSDRLFFTEPPIYQSIVYVLYSIFGVKEYLARLVSVFFSLGSIIFLYLIVRKFLGIRIALWSSFFYAFLPYAVYYSRTTLPEPLTTFCALLGFFVLLKWKDKDSFLLLFFSSIFFSLSFALNPFRLVYLLPVIYLFFKKYKLYFLKSYKFWFFMVVSVIPLILWRYYITSYPPGIPASNWLFNEGGIRFTGAFFIWIFNVRLGELILGTWGLIFLIIGIIRRPGEREGWLFHLWLLGMIAYLFIVAKGNVTHDYYQFPLIPVLVIFLGKGIDFMFSKSSEFSFGIKAFLAVVILLFTFAFSWYQVRGYYWINNPTIVNAGKEADKILPKDARVITPYNGDVAFLYQTNRHGWALFEGSVVDMINKGAQYVVAANPDPSIKNLEKKYKVIEETQNFVIIKLE